MRFSFIVLLAIAPRIASAQYNVPSQASGDSRQSIEIAADEPATPKAETPIGEELGASLDFMTTTEKVFGDKKLELTDIVLFRVHGLISIGRRLELFGGVDLLPKQPSFTDEHKWQGTLAGARFKFDQHWSGYLRGQFGPNLNHDGFWAMGEGALQFKRDIAEKALFWESTLGGTYTQLFFDNQDKPFLLTELLAETGLAVRDRHGFFATWLTFGFHFPIAGQPETTDELGRRNDPQVRVGVYFGMLGGVSKTLDLFVEVSMLDRGDIENSATTLPILSGGFDQRRVLFGFNRRFGKRRR